MPVLLPAVPIRSGVTRYVGATLIDGTGAAPVPDSEVEVRDGAIAFAGPRRDIAVADAQVVDLAGRHLMPGFVDAHVHLSMVDTDAETQRGQFIEESVFAVGRVLEKTLAAGITTARDLDGLTPGYRNAIAAGSAIGPRLHLALSMLSPTGGHADPVLPNGALPAWAVRPGTPPAGVVDTDADIVTMVRSLLRSGADVIKVCTSGGAGKPTDEAGLTEQQVRLVVSLLAGRDRRPTVTAHALTDAGVRAAVLGGAASVEHGYDMSDETIQLMVDRGTVLIPTLSTLMRELAPDQVTPARLAAREALRQRGLDSIRRAVTAGVTLAMGTDAGVHPHGRNLRELAWLVEAGLTPLEAVCAGTLTGARLLGLDDRIGSIEEGKTADLVVTDVDPLSDPIGMCADAAVRLVLQSGCAVVDRLAA
ncbi:amidohydrolase family protein [Microbacterium indicum]|uniref:amidohydrolase family protein n=1 Tax=Microbacterium indicum TaxID=358100 RepID=UPI0003F73440|nr:amidohydrolase family protein [Microbacterium indicum]